MLTSKSLSLLLRDVQCQRNAISHLRATRPVGHAYPMLTRSFSLPGLGYLQKPDKTHPVRTGGGASAAANDGDPKGTVKSVKKPFVEKRIEDMTQAEQAEGLQRMLAAPDQVRLDVWAAAIPVAGELSVYRIVLCIL